MTDTPQINPPTHFNFDHTLWRRFITIAQSYWIPAEQSPWRFFGLLVVLMLLVVSTTFFLFLGFAFGGQLLLPDFFRDVAPGVVSQADSFVSSPILPGAIGVFAFAILVFVANRGSLRSRWVQWSLLFLLLVLLFVVNGANVALSFIFRFIDNAFQSREEPVFWRYLFTYLALLVSAIPIIVLYRYSRLKLGLFWREWLTQRFLGRYFNQRSYYELDSNASNTEIDNPDQRITEDVFSFTSTTLTFLLDVLDSVLNLISFTAVLYGFSRLLTVGLVVYALLGTAVAVLLGRRLIGLNFNQLRLEANFRYGMVHVRDNAESIAFYRGEPQETKQVIERLRQAIRNQDLLIIWQSLISLFQLSYNYFSRFVPYLVLAPLYFSEQIDFGAIGQGYFAFSMVLGAVSIVTSQIQSISSFAAGINRLGAF
ncbi:MAG: SbmA/BacA-like family transporter, partial [Cyanophyceae cyanobacterium]